MAECVQLRDGKWYWAIPASNAAHAKMVEKVRSIIDTLRDYGDDGLADKLAAAIGDKP